MGVDCQRRKTHPFFLSQLVVLRDPNEDSDDILRAHRSREKQYVFDHTFGPLSTQAEVYRGAGQGVVHKVMEGYNSTIFAYGATGEELVVGEVLRQTPF